VRRFVIAFAAVAAAAAAATALAGSPAMSQEPERTTLTLFDPAKGGFQKFVVANRNGFQRLVRRPPDRASAGDWSVFTDPFLDPQTCERVGRNIARSMVIKPLKGGDAVAMFDGGIVLKEGKLTFRLPGRFSEEPAKIAITGGTGAYKDATGEVTFTPGVKRCDQRGSLAVADLLLR
jgi:hypothetical protein